ncbi:hypothetical protein CT676_17320 [Bradyrhizobium sp. MOS001]|uniref:hypothetical protein n=1 Tax=Bradyrhizobium sp. MOS001 TaxID=2133948 RepID=UPI001074F375|nr:hypothetical protein [Bradyrhizobium sp. MOS001]TFW59900.1 hypothetical protein CT676_17320 [Bradyrhizobium sp. MOS001]
MLEIINNLPTRLIECDLGLQDDPVSQILWLIVASAAGTLVYHIPEGKPNLVTQRKKSARFLHVSGSQGGFCKNENARP